jgi:hypothetical protein
MRCRRPEYQPPASLKEPAVRHVRRRFRSPPVAAVFLQGFAVILRDDIDDPIASTSDKLEAAEISRAV